MAGVASGAEIYTCGRGENGELGSGERDRFLELPAAVDASALRARNITRVACGQFHSLAVTADGALFAWGGGGSAQLGVGDGEDHASPVSVTTLQERSVVDVAGGRSHSLVCTESGDVFSWGRVAFGQLGHGDTSDQLEPRVVDSLHGVKIGSVQCGESHSMALATSGRVYVWGRGNNGRLGLGNLKAQLYPRFLEALSGRKVVSIAAGYYHSAALTDTGEVFTWGCGHHGQLGHGDNADQLLPKKVEALEREHVVQIAAGGFHMIAVTSTGEVFAWGNSEKGQCGFGWAGNSAMPMLVEGLLGKQVVHVAAGRGHTAAITANGELYTWGEGKYGQLGHGDTAQQLDPRVVAHLQGRQVAHVACGAWHTAVIVK